MSEQAARRKELKARYKQAHPEAGVYRLLNRESGRYYLGSSPDLASVRNKLEFAKSVDSAGPRDGRRHESIDRLGTWLGGYRGATDVDQRLSEDVRQFGIESFSFEVLEVLETKPEMTRAQILADLSILEGLWREKLDPALLY